MKEIYTPTMEWQNFKERVIAGIELVVTINDKVRKKCNE